MTESHFLLKMKYKRKFLYVKHVRQKPAVTHKYIQKTFSSALRKPLHAPSVSFYRPPCLLPQERCFFCFTHPLGVTPTLLFHIFE